MDWGGGTVCRERSFIIKEKTIPKDFTRVKLKDSSNMDKVGIYTFFVECVM